MDEQGFVIIAQSNVIMLIVMIDYISSSIIRHTFSYMNVNG